MKRIGSVIISGRDEHEHQKASNSNRVQLPQQRWCLQRCAWKLPREELTEKTHTPRNLKHLQSSDSLVDYREARGLATPCRADNSTSDVTACTNIGTKQASTYRPLTVRGRGA